MKSESGDENEQVLYKSTQNKKGGKNEKKNPRIVQH